MGPHADEAFMAFLSEAKGTILDIGSSSSRHSSIMKDLGKDISTVDIDPSHNTTYVGDFMALDLPKFDAIWCCHTLEHMPNPNMFLKKVYDTLNADGVLAITVPPFRHEIAGGHVTLWNAGLLLYNLIMAGFDCSNASVKSYSYNISVILKKKPIIDTPSLNYDSGDIDLLSDYFPFKAFEGFDGNIMEYNWNYNFEDILPPKPLPKPKDKSKNREKKLMRKIS